MSVSNSKRRTAVLTYTKEQWGDGKIFVAIDLIGSVRDTSVIAKLEPWVTCVFQSVFNAKRVNPHYAAWWLLEALDCSEAYHLAVLAKQLYFQSHANFNSRPSPNHQVGIITGIIRSQCTHNSFYFPFSEQIFIWLLMKYRRLIAENLQGHIYCTRYSKPHLVH